MAQSEFRIPLLLGMALLLAACSAAAAGPSIALYYGNAPPLDELAAFDIAVVDPAHVPDPKPHSSERSRLYAYVSVVEVHPQRDYAQAIPSQWKLGTNTAWGSIVIDQAQPAWPAFFRERVIKPLWDAGYRGFFLDTLDSYHLVAKDDAERARQEAGLAATITELKRAYPEAKLIFNRGFEILPRVHHLAQAVAAESLYRGWDNSNKAYREVPEADRVWLLAQLKRVKDEYRLPVLAIDYVAPEERELARATAKKISALGFIPWVSNPALDMLGVGDIEVLPRKILMLYDQENPAVGLIADSIQRFAAMPVNYLGYVPEYVEVQTQALPEHVLAGRYAGVVTWFTKDERRNEKQLAAFLARAIAQNLKIAVLGNLGLNSPALLDQVFGLKRTDARGISSRLAIDYQSPQIGYEAAPFLDRSAFFPLQASGGTPLLRLKNERGEIMDAIAMMPWGGYALPPNSLYFLPAFKGGRWVVNPIEFLREALALPAMPVPDTTTENGRRLMLVHVDGDGFASRAELPGTPFAGEVMLRDVLQKYRVPSTVSIIEGEIAANGLYPKLTPLLEPIARRIFALPHVEIASHTYSHPFRWRKVEHDVTADGYNLDIPNYDFDIKAEVDGSLAYINSRLAPPGKRARVFLWTGDCNPGDESVEETVRAGVLNMNGGDTWISKAERTLSLVSPLGIPRGANFQVFAPDQNENIYTNLWTGPYYGYERVIETFELTDAPYRLKPIDVYYHVYAASKRASLNALHKVYAWALAQPVFNVYASEYIERVFDFRRMVVARSGERYLVRGGGMLRELRLPAAAGYPDLADSRGVAGYADHNGQRYLHLAADEASFRLVAAPQRLPYLAEANGRIRSYTRSGAELGLTLDSHTPLRFTLANAAGCSLRTGGQALAAAQQSGEFSRYELKPNGTTALTLRCGG
ncbi:MAG: bifunctional glycoside hydrolase 114/ polysaccharide deacetylase family protein [Burkholderiales bacterium]|nr:bifunctional glycoside hydrolase 114/ polysaccharide deacetylase family protein [Burkholderiales bacterium]